MIIRQSTKLKIIISRMEFHIGLCRFDIHFIPSERLRHYLVKKFIIKKRKNGRGNEIDRGQATRGCG